MKRTLTILCAWSLVVLGTVLIPSLASAQAGPETFTATASVKSDTVVGALPVKIAIKNYISDADRQVVLEALKTGGDAAARKVLEKLPDLGVVEVLNKTTPVKYAFSRSLGPGAGRMITVVTAVPIHYVKAGTSGEKPKEGYNLGIALLILDTNDAGDGEMNPAAKIKLDQSGALVTDDYGGVKVWLKSVAKAK